MMALIGEQLLAPETGWRRYDDTHSSISNYGNVKKVSDITGAYQGTYSSISASDDEIVNDNSIKFNFVGSKIRLMVTSSTPWVSNNALIIIDNTPYRFDAGIHDITTYQVLVFEKVDLKYEEHNVIITIDDNTSRPPLNNEKRVIEVDAIDIDANGELLPYKKLFHRLIKSNNKFYTYQNNEFIEVEPTVENFKEKSILLSDLITPTNKVVLTMEEGEDLGDGKIFRKTIDVNKYKDIENIYI